MIHHRSFPPAALSSTGSLTGSQPAYDLLLRAFVWAIGGGVLIFAFQVHAAPPRALLVSLLAGTTVIGFRAIKFTELSLLPKFYLLLYALPFGVQLGYLFDDQYIWWDTPRAVALQTDEDVAQSLLLIALVGLYGLLWGFDAGAILFRPTTCGIRLPTGTAGLRPEMRTLATPLFVVLVLIAIGLSSISAARETVLVASYATEQTQSVAAELNFNGAFLASYVILILCMIDHERERHAATRQIKLVVFMVATAYIVLFLQLLRGDRESSGLLAGMACLYVTRTPSDQHARIRRLLVPLAVAVAVFIVLGFVRSEVSQRELSASELMSMLVEGLTYNTWTGVSLTNLGLAAEYQQGLEPLGGQTYIDYLLSLPPGAICQIIGFERPLDGKNSPNWWYDVAGGGIHPAVVPFKNFGIIGVFLILGAYGVFVSFCEFSNRRGDLWSRFLFGTVAACGFLWFWYGDMNIVRGLMSAALLYYAYLFVGLLRRAGSGGLPSRSLAGTPAERAVLFEEGNHARRHQCTVSSQRRQPDQPRAVDQRVAPGRRV